MCTRGGYFRVVLQRDGDLVQSLNISSLEAKFNVLSLKDKEDLGQEVGLCLVLRPEILMSWGSVGNDMMLL